MNNKKIYNCALNIEKEESLNKEMKEWEITIKDGLENENWLFENPKALKKE